jgi:hypothetical protein
MLKMTMFHSVTGVPQMQKWNALRVRACFGSRSGDIKCIGLTHFGNQLNKKNSVMFPQRCSEY